METGRMMTAVVGGAAAGLVGTLAMDLLWFKRARDAGSDAEFSDFEFSGDVTDFDEAGAPAKLAQMGAEAVGTSIPEEHAGTATDVVHWATGAGYGSLTAAGAAAIGLNPLAAGLAAGALAFTGAYTILPALGLYDPAWEYDGKTLAKDATAHATYGAGTGVALAAIGLVSTAIRRRNQPRHVAARTALVAALTD